jgi:hypothetical protein
VYVGWPHEDVVGGWVVLGEVVGEVVCALLPVHGELSLANSVLDPIEAHVHGFGSLDFGLVVGKPISCRVVGGDAGWLGLFPV